MISPHIPSQAVVSPFVLFLFTECTRVILSYIEEKLVVQIFLITQILLLRLGNGKDGESFFRIRYCRFKRTLTTTLFHLNYVIFYRRSTFTLQTNGHDREIISYEVVLGSVERMQIGWINEAKYIENLTNDPNNGVGEEANSIALDCCRGGFLNQGDFTKLRLSIGEGSVIRCEQKTRRWLVDGELVVSSIASDDAVHFENELLPPACGKVDKIIPSFSGKVRLFNTGLPNMQVLGIDPLSYFSILICFQGSWRISQIVLSNP